MVMQLVEAGKIDLNADVNRYLDFRITRPGRAADDQRPGCSIAAGFEEGAQGPARQRSGSCSKTTERHLQENTRPFLLWPGEWASGLFQLWRRAGRLYRPACRVSRSRPMSRATSPARSGWRTPPLSNRYRPRRAARSQGQRHQSDGPPRSHWSALRPQAASPQPRTIWARFMLAHLGGGNYGGARILPRNGRSCTGLAGVACRRLRHDGARLFLGCSATVGR